MIQSVTRYPLPVTHYPSPATNHQLPATRYPPPMEKRCCNTQSIGNVRIRPIQEHLFLFIEKQRCPLMKSPHTMIHLNKRQFDWCVHFDCSSNLILNWCDMHTSLTHSMIT